MDCSCVALEAATVSLGPCGIVGAVRIGSAAVWEVGPRLGAGEVGGLDK